MRFPDEPATDDQRYGQLLGLMSIAKYPGVYVLGSFAKYVTVYAQQVRALNLIDALAKAGVLSRYSNVAVVGGGIAGMTAAAAAAVRGAGRVSVLESLANSMRIQRGSKQRFIHPYIYDWPKKGRGDADRLPLMSWEPDAAANVVKQLDAKWKEIQEGVGGRLLDPRYNCEVKEVGSEGGKPFVRVGGGAKETFDVVILAVGFGLDAHTGINESYWADGRLDNFEIEKSEQTWFVSGYGDGALTDLMRLCIMDFRHADVIAEADASGHGVGERLLEAERSYKTPDELALAYRDAAHRMGDKLGQKLMARPMVGKVWLNCSEGELFSPRSSVLNRLITAYLLNERRFELVGRGKILDPKKTAAGYEITFEGDAAPSMVVDNVIIRHGPDRALRRCFPDIWENFDGQLGGQWESARQHNDWTREPLYAPEDFDWKNKRVPPLRVDFGDKAGCVVITGSHRPKGLDQAGKVGEALRLFSKRMASKDIAGITIDPKPELIAAKDALSSAAAYERAVRALCETDFAVFDITGRESAVMLFLGIRAAVRRGVTVTLSHDEVATNPLPFNLASLNPVSMTADTEQITDALEAGLAGFKAQPSAYLDLPAFDAVRRLGEDHRPLGPEEQILILRWFNPEYNEAVRGLLNPILREKFEETSPTSIVTTLDSKSPQLVEQRLYAAIRRTQLCIIDWTGWRTNVFFETGVRLAVNKTDPIFMLCTSHPPEWDDEHESSWLEETQPSARALLEFFAPTKFTFNDFEDLRGRVVTFNDASPVRPDRAKIAPGRTYQVVYESLNRRDEPGGRSASDLLMLEAQGIAGPAVPEEGSPLPVLYSEALSEQVRQAATEYLLAAWFYLDGRYELIKKFKAGRLPPDDPHLSKLRQVGLDLIGRRRNMRRGDEFHEAMKKVLKGWQVIGPAEEGEDE